MSATPAQQEMSTAELDAIRGRLNVGGLFGAHAHTDVIRLLAEVQRLRQLVAHRAERAVSSVDGGAA
ncbi:MAG: hypothetical protein M3042_07795 [Actinomycetota bacterium]|nr:hypothetical protein [Actinomycetota bacterium]